MDELDKRILWELLKDGRRSFTSIAKENDLSEDTVWKRYKEMLKKGIIVGATIQYNYKLFGYSAIADVRLIVESQNINSVLESLIKWPLIGDGAKVLDSLNNWPLTSEGAKGAVRIYGTQYSLTIIFLFKTLGELESAKDIISRQNPINGFNTHLWMESRAIPENIVECFCQQYVDVVKKDSKEEEPQELVKLDELDLQIVDKLSNDGRMPFRKIAKEIGVSIDTITRRYEKLKNNNYIKPILQINPSKLGYQGFLTIFVEMSVKSYIKEVIEKLSKIVGVHDFIRLSGTFDLEIVAHVKDCNAIIAIHEEITKIPYVKRVESSLASVFPSWPPRRTTITTF